MLLLIPQKASENLWFPGESKWKIETYNFIIKRLQHRCFLVSFSKFLRTPFLKNICERLLLKVLNLQFIMSQNSLPHPNIHSDFKSTNENENSKRGYDTSTGPYAKEANRDFR